MRKILLVVIVVLIPAVGGCFNLFQEKKNWDFIQSVGGIDVEEPHLKDGVWRLPVKCDVSGLSEITIQPTLVNSALACAKVDSEVEGRSIYLTVITALIDKGHNSPFCGETVLDKTLSGEYDVFYKGPDGKIGDIGKIRIKPQQNNEPD